MRFSQRQGFRPIRSTLQITAVDKPLRNGLWNVIDANVLRLSGIPAFGEYGHTRFYSILWVVFFQQRTDQEVGDDYTRHYIENWVFANQEDSWFRVYDLIEFCLEWFDFDRMRNHGVSREDFVSECNICLEREMSAYRIVGDQVAPLTSEEEIAAIDEASLRDDHFGPVATHIQRAVELLSDRKAPDFRNSIKEAISAVESMCGLVTGKPKATLGDALKQLDASGVELHPALRDAFGKLYGFTSDAHGIRHGLMDKPKLDFEDAKFMLVSCSAFVNLLKARAP